MNDILASRPLSVALLMVCAIAVPVVAIAQRPPTTQEPPAAPAAPPAAEDRRPPRAARPPREPAQPEKPKPESVTLKTRDGVQLRALYLKSDKGRGAIPVMLIHEWNGQASPYLGLAESLQSAGFAVLIPEYRGHGGSRKYTDHSGAAREFDTARMSRRDIEAILTADLESAKGFLKDKNNAGELNLNALVLIGVREGAVLAGNWAHNDWAFPSVGSRKQGQDVKGLIYISPDRSFKGITMEVTVRDPFLLALPTLIIAGGESPEASEAVRLGKQIELFKKKMSPRGTVTGYGLLMPPSTLSGQAMVNPPLSGTVTPIIQRFITNEVVVTDDQNQWIERK